VQLLQLLPADASAEIEQPVKAGLQLRRLTVVAGELAAAPGQQLLACDRRAGAGGEKTQLR